MSWYLNESNIKLNIAKRKIITSLLLNNYELISICFCKLYTAGKNNKSWLYTGLEGGLTLVIDYRRKTARFLLFDLKTLEIVFENEFYRKFNIFYSNLSENFQCFEVSGGFIGFNIPDKYDADKFFNAVSGLTDQTIARKAKEIKIINIVDIKNNAKKILNVLQEKLNDEYFFKENLAYESMLEFDFYHLEKVFEYIEYDSKNKTFCVSGSDEEINNFANTICGIKIKDEKGQRIADPKAYISELYKNFENTNKLIKKNETEKQEQEDLIKAQNEKLKKEAEKNNKSNYNNTKDAVKQDNKQQNVNINSIFLSEDKGKPSNQNTNIPNLPSNNIPSVPSVPKPSIPNPPSSNTNIPKPPTGPASIPKPPTGPASIPKPPTGPPGIPKIPTVPTGPQNPPPSNNSLLMAIQSAGTNKNNLLKKPPVVNDRSGAINTETSNTLPSESINNNDGGQAPAKKPMDMMSELRMKMANKMANNTSAEPKINNNPNEVKINANNNTNAYNIVPVGLKPVMNVNKPVANNINNNAVKEVSQNNDSNLKEEAKEGNKNNFILFKSNYSLMDLYLFYINILIKTLRCKTSNSSKNWNGSNDRTNE